MSITQKTFTKIEHLLNKTIGYPIDAYIVTDDTYIKRYENPLFYKIHNIIDTCESYLLKKEIWIERSILEIPYKLKSRFIKKHWQIDTGLDRYSYHDRVLTIKHAMFEEFCRFIDEEKPFGGNSELDWCNDERFEELHKDIKEDNPKYYKRFKERRDKMKKIYLFWKTLPALEEAGYELMNMKSKLLSSTLSDREQFIQDNVFCYSLNNRNELKERLSESDRNDLEQIEKQYKDNEERIEKDTIHYMKMICELHQELWT